MMLRRKSLLLLGSLFASRIVGAETVIVDSRLASSYHFVDTYEVLIDRPPEVVWPQLVDFRSWMFDLAATHVSGPTNAEGEVFRLYEGQDFLAEISKIVPGRMIVIVNLPSTLQGENMVGISMLTLTEVDGKSLVTNFMSRQLSGPADALEPLRARRESAEYREFNASMQGKFLARLRELAEAAD